MLQEKNLPHPPRENRTMHMHYGGSKIRLKQLASLWSGQWSARLGKVHEFQRCPAAPPTGARGGAAGRGLVCWARSEALTGLTCGRLAPVHLPSHPPRPQVWADWAVHLGEWKPCSGHTWPGLGLTFGEERVGRILLCLCLNLKPLALGRPSWPLLAGSPVVRTDGAAEAGTQSPRFAQGVTS